MNKNCRVYIAKKEKKYLKNRESWKFKSRHWQSRDNYEESEKSVLEYLYEIELSEVPYLLKKKNNKALKW